MTLEGMHEGESSTVNSVPAAFTQLLPNIKSRHCRNMVSPCGWVALWQYRITAGNSKGLTVLKASLIRWLNTAAYLVQNKRGSTPYQRTGHSPEKHTGASPNGKARGFDPRIWGFDPLCPSFI